MGNGGGLVYRVVEGNRDFEEFGWGLLWYCGYEFGFILYVFWNFFWMMFNLIIINELICLMEEKVCDKFYVLDKDSGNKVVLFIEEISSVKGILVVFFGLLYRFDRVVVKEIWLYIKWVVDCMYYLWY